MKSTQSFMPITETDSEYPKQLTEQKLNITTTVQFLQVRRQGITPLSLCTTTTVMPSVLPTTAKSITTSRMHRMM